MIVGQHSEERFGAKRKQLQFFVTQREGKNGKIDGEVAQAFDQHRRSFFNDAQLGFRIFLRKGRGIARDQIGRDGGDGADGHAAANIGALIFDAGSRRLHLDEEWSGRGAERRGRPR